MERDRSYPLLSYILSLSLSLSYLLSPFHSPILSYPILSSPILSYPILSYLFLVLFPMISSVLLLPEEDEVPDPLFW